MGFFDQLKKAANFLSGGGATLELRIDPSYKVGNSNVPVKILCHVKDNPLFIDKLYLKIKAEETIRFRDYGTYHNQQHHHHHHGQTRTQTATTYKHEVIVDENFRLDPLGEYEWNTELFIPDNSYGTYRGVNAAHEWKVMAGLSKSGTDPKSKWVIFDV